MKIETRQGFSHKMVELKARVDDHEVLRKKLSTMGAEHVGTFHQTDLYFRVPEGRLKLREVKDSITTELIYYEREDISGPKNDDAFILRIQQADDLKMILKQILTPLRVIEKVREIYHYKGTQIHLDTVKKLGKFIEFERQTNNYLHTTENDHQILEKLMRQLDIPSCNLEVLSYSDIAET